MRVRVFLFFYAESFHSLFLLRRYIFGTVQFNFIMKKRFNSVVVRDFLEGGVFESMSDIQIQN